MTILPFFFLGRPPPFFGFVALDLQKAVYLFRNLIRPKLRVESCSCSAMIRLSNLDCQGLRSTISPT